MGNRDLTLRFPLFHDCHHTHEPGCALREAVAAGKIDVRGLELLRQIAGHRK